ncbi:glycosyltransferase [Moritella sp. Urea-trap-13]|uniref:glycosyltransferase n=1 Tax=Moritella sp. Urea-trap-13 TaxID=2058327 RepID=UPI000C332B98|nr:glycosyltransferase [Moritella sp. Urea-trap-13]PKH06234.1 glycosyltransferase [Moritella sp. Urea-trap-13]
MINWQWIVFGEDWGRHPSSTQHLMKCMATQHQVYWVNSIGLRRPRLHDGKRILEKLKQLNNAKGNDFNQHDTQLLTDAQPLGILAPVAIPWPGSHIAYVINRLLLTYQTRALLAKHKHKTKDEEIGTKAPRILWLSLPTGRCVISSLEEDLVVYYAGDDFSALNGVDHKQVSVEEMALVKHADVIFAASEIIASQFPQEKTYLLPHGVDLKHFSSNFERPSNYPDADLVVGYYGSITSWLDFELITFLAQSRPDVTFLFIGKIEIADCVIFEYNNIIHLSDMPHEQLIQYAANWQVSLIPFVDNEQIRACNPLKLREYLAIGHPILSTRYPAVTAFTNCIYVADDKYQMLAQLNLTLVLPSQALEQLKSRSRKMVKTATWQARCELVTTLLAARLAEKLTIKSNM